MEHIIPIGLPIIIAREGKWFVATCPVLELATQGATEDEVKKNMKSLIVEYYQDPDTPKPDIRSVMSLSISNVPVDLPEGVLYGKAATARPA